MYVRNLFVYTLKICFHCRPSKPCMSASIARFDKEASI